MQYFKKGVEAVAKNLNRLVCRINVVIFQLIKNTPIAIPTVAALNAFTFPKYSGTKNRASAPKLFKKPLLMVLANITQKIKDILQQLLHLYGLFLNVLLIKTSYTTSLLCSA